ncbi:MAG TPA: ABC transporter substrate-binding protein [Reyranella sp.]|nr:ABC transporter substrate-binding protein [Reyranella sp.]
MSASAFAESAGKMARVCFITVDPPTTTKNRYTPFFDRLRALGYVDGRTLALDWLSANGDAGAFPALVNECLRRKSDVIVTGTTPATQAAKTATAAVPIVMLALGDPVGTGLVASLARPGGNVSGTTQLAPLMIAKGLELLNRAVPGLKRVLVITYPADPISQGQVKSLQQAARVLNIELLVQGVAGPEDFAEAFAAGEKANVQGLLVTVESILVVHRAELAALARRHKLPSVSSQDLFVQAGGLLSYDANRDVLAARTADYVDKVLKGSRPADLPVEEPTVFTIAVNAGTAQALGITLPSAIVANADELFE